VEKSTACDRRVGSHDSSIIVVIRIQDEMKPNALE
jgi:hypothetical protein